MKARPILFSSAMVRALLNGTKTQTRRIVKPQPERYDFGYGCIDDAFMPPQITNGFLAVGVTTMLTDHFAYLKHLPYGGTGDRLWVREEHFRFGHWESVTGKRTKGGRQKWAFVADSADFRFEAPPAFRKGRHHKDPATPAWHKRLARFMPRRLSRITLELTAVRVERLNDISESDAQAEGVEQLFVGDPSRAEAATGIWRDYHHDEKGQARFAFPDAKASYASLWESINGAGSWSLNPYVWVLEFKRV